MRYLVIPAVLILTMLLSIFACSDSDHYGGMERWSVGWAIGDDPEGTAAILHTDNGGTTWEEQGDSRPWKGMWANDISAVDEFTAWAAVGHEKGGAILHTSDGGFNWRLQTLPEGVTEEIKGIKGLSRDVAWAATISGVVMHTLDGGVIWTIIPHEGIVMKQINRIDALGEDIWIADFGSGEHGIIHSADSGKTWRQETLLDPDFLGSQFGPMAVSIVSRQVVWAAVRPAAHIYRTLDGGDTWSLDAPDVSGPNDLDDICALNAYTAWAVQNIGGQSGGRIIRVRLIDGEVFSDIMDPARNYQYEGLTCFDENTLWVAGFKAYGASADLRDGVILHTSDGGVTWENQELSAKNIALWKISFAGAHR